LKYSLLSKRLLVDLALQIKCFLKQENIVENKIWPVKRPLVSVIIPCFNYGKFLSETIESVLNQTFSDFEIVVVDDGSTDSYTREILSTLNKPKTRLISQKNQGISMARNNGIRNAEGKYICCLDADDLLTPTYLEKCVYLLETRQIDICYSWVQLFGADNLLWRTGPFRIDELLKGNTVSTAAVFSRKAWKRAKGYSKKMRKGYEDWEFWIRMARLGVGGSVILEPLFLYRKHGVSMTSSTDKIHDQLCKQIRYLHRDICDNEFKIKKILELQLKAESNKHNSYFNILRKL
jgi:glycosyltransferase involved in cell wall biosynthesis